MVNSLCHLISLSFFDIPLLYYIIIISYYIFYYYISYIIIIYLTISNFLSFFLRYISVSKYFFFVCFWIILWWRLLDFWDSFETSCFCCLLNRSFETVLSICSGLFLMIKKVSERIYYLGFTYNFTHISSKRQNIHGPLKILSLLVELNSVSFDTCYTFINN